MTKQNLRMSAFYWGIYLVFAFLIWRQHDESSFETVRYMTYLWIGVYAVAVLIVCIKNLRK